MRRFLFHALLLALLAGAGALVFVGGGFVPIAADEGHWPATRKLLQFAMHRSVATQSLGIRAPPLDDPALVRKGAGHYAGSCMPCHGGPGVERPVLPRAMLPEPPPLVRVMASRQWSRPQLFWIVKHGIKMTGMPAWGKTHDDEVLWSVVSFMQKLPELDAKGYHDLVAKSPMHEEAESAGHSHAPGTPPHRD